MKKFQVRFEAEKFLTVAAENEDELLKKLEQLDSAELRNMLGFPEWGSTNVDEMPDEVAADLVLQDKKFWVNN